MVGMYASYRYVSDAYDYYGEELTRMSKGFGWQRYKKYLYQLLSRREFQHPYILRKQDVSLPLVTSSDL